MRPAVFQLHSESPLERIRYISIELGSPSVARCHRHTGELVFAKQLAEGCTSLGEQIDRQVESDESFFDL